MVKPLVQMEQQQYEEVLRATADVADFGDQGTPCPQTMAERLAGAS